MDNNWRISRDQAIKMIIASLIIVAGILWQIHKTETAAQLILRYVVKDQFHGRVDSVYRDRQDHNAKKVRLETGYIYGFYPEWENEVELGDSLSKKEGSFIVEVFKHNGKKVILDYRVLVKGYKK
ncbi:MAG: hypothetical protein ACXVAY_11950 [Mucilaginibacter sp.]